MASMAVPQVRFSSSREFCSSRRHCSSRGFSSSRRFSSKNSIKAGGATVSMAAEAVRRFYDAVNKRQIEQAGDLIAKECVYEDLVFSKPFVGRKDIVEFFKTFTDSVSPELTFVIDDISDGELSVGVTWHLDWRGKAFPFSKGCSFYRISGEDFKIIYGRDCVEPAFKADLFALKVIGAVTWLFERFPKIADSVSKQ